MKIFWFIVVTILMILSLLIFISAAIIISPFMGVKHWNDTINRIDKLIKLKAAKNG